MAKLHFAQLHLFCFVCLFNFPRWKKKTLTKAGTIPVVSVALASGRVSAGSPEIIICRVVDRKMSPLLNSLHQRNGVMGTYPGKRQELLSEFFILSENANSLQLSHHASKLFTYYFSSHQYQWVYISLSVYSILLQWHYYCWYNCIYSHKVLS